MLTLSAGQVESLWDEVLPIEARELPDDLARLDRVLSDPALLGPVAAAWEGSARERGRPSIAIATFVALDGGQAAHRVGLRDIGAGGFGLAASAALLSDRDRSAGAGESTVRKLARRLGAEVVEEITRVVIAKAQRETRFRGRAARVDS